MNSRGLALQELRRFPEAVASFDRAIELAPDNADYHFSRGLLLLLLGNFADGWREYEWRRKQNIWFDRRLKGREWRGGRGAGQRGLPSTRPGLWHPIQLAR